MNALRNIHAALIPNGLLVDTQPISSHPPLVANDAELGTLDMSEWVETVSAVDQRVSEAIVSGLYELTSEREFVVTSVFDDGPDCLEVAGAGKDTCRSRSQIDSQARASRYASNSTYGFAFFDALWNRRPRAGHRGSR